MLLEPYQTNILSIISLQIIDAINLLTAAAPRIREDARRLAEILTINPEVSCDHKSADWNGEPLTAEMAQQKKWKLLNRKRGYEGRFQKKCATSWMRWKSRYPSNSSIWKNYPDPRIKSVVTRWISFSAARPYVVRARAESCIYEFQTQGFSYPVNRLVNIIDNGKGAL